ncbi:MAG TPA: flagellar biosynthetic protein FliO [Steroidobacteraceae bacterium]|jgi:flagellar protein FliO/FliZ|nr:flagellar biosynthetic protein FliO [Steroidobacteraceae bacterium]
MFAAPQTAPATHVGGLGGLGEVTLALLLVLGAVFALAWLLKRVRGFNSRVGSSLEVIAHVPLGAKERAVLLKVGPTQLLIGVAPGRVNALYVLPEPLEPARPASAPANGAPGSFRTLLKNLTR